MASAAVVVGGFLALGLFILHTVAVATTHWYVVTVGTGVFSASMSVGLFRICVDTSLTDAECFTYNSYISTYNLVSFNYIAITGLNVVGCILLFVNVVIGVVGCASTRGGRPTVQNLAGIWFFAAACIIAGVAWFYITQYQDSEAILALITVATPELGYSFYMAAVAGGGAGVAAIIMCVVAGNMDVPGNVAPLTTVPGGPQVFVMNTGQPHMGQTHFPQAGQTGYPQAGQTGYPQYGQAGPTGYPPPGQVESTGHPQHATDYK